MKGTWSIRVLVDSAEVNSASFVFLLVNSDLTTGRLGPPENKVRIDQSSSGVKVRIDQGSSGVKVRIDPSLNLSEHALGEAGGNWFRSNSSNGSSSRYSSSAVVGHDHVVTCTCSCTMWDGNSTRGIWEVVATVFYFGNETRNSMEVYHMSHVMRKPVYAICEPQRRRQSDQRLCCSLLG